VEEKRESAEGVIELLSLNPFAVGRFLQSRIATSKSNSIVPNVCSRRSLERPAKRCRGHWQNFVIADCYT